jgi:putative tricarboxylic transport membrane protein
LLVCFSASVNFVMALVDRRDAGRDFVELDKLKLVLAVLVPTGIYVALIGWLGIYLTSAVFIGFFMRWLGKYPWWKVAAVSVGTMVAFFLIFESWFKVPLPKGPLENLLGVG